MADRHVHAIRDNWFPMADRHSNLPSDWDLHQGFRFLVEAVNGLHGLRKQEQAEYLVQMACLVLSQGERHVDR